MQTPTKVDRKHVVITFIENQQKRVEKSLYSKFQLKIAEWLKIQVAEQYQYLFDIQYKGNVKLKQGDALANEQGIIFAVVHEKNKVAKIVTMVSYLEIPNIKGKLYLIEMPEELKTK